MKDEANPPKVIYLQFYGCDSKAEGKAAEITWCEDRIYKTDIRYVLPKCSRLRGRNRLVVDEHQCFSSQDGASRQEASRTPHP